MPDYAGRLLTAEPTKDHLTAARMATLLREARSPNAVAFREEVLAMLYGVRTKATEAAGKRHRRPQQREAAVHAQTLDALLGDLLWASDHAVALGYCYRSSDRQAFTDGATKASSRAYEWQVPALVSAGVIDFLLASQLGVISMATVFSSSGAPQGCGQPRH